MINSAERHTEVSAAQDTRLERLIPPEGRAVSGDVEFSCPQCKRGLECDAAYVGDTVTCPVCQSLIQVPGELHGAGAWESIGALAGIGGARTPEALGGVAEGAQILNGPETNTTNAGTTFWPIAVGLGLVVGGLVSLTAGLLFGLLAFGTVFAPICACAPRRVLENPRFQARIGTKYPLLFRVVCLFSTAAVWFLWFLLILI